MGWSMDWSKDFISFWKLAKKKNNLINWSILPRFPPPAQLDYPQNNRIVLPLRPPSFTHPIPSLVRRCRSFFVDCCVVYDVLQPFNAATNFYFCLFLLLSLSPQTKLKRPPKHVPPRSRAITDVISIEDADVRLVVMSLHRVAATYGHGPILLSHNFCRINSTTKLTIRRPPTRSAPAARPPRLLPIV